MNKASFIYKANIKRYLALCIYRLLSIKEEQNLDQNDLWMDDVKKAIKLLEEAYNDFKKGNCQWGMGICKYL